MGVNIYLQDERGNKLDKWVDPGNPIYAIINTYKIGRYKKGEFCLFNGIDLYGDTYFNRQQMPQLKKECKDLKKIINEKELLYFLDRLMLLIDKGMNEIHQYIKFEGD